MASNAKRAATCVMGAYVVWLVFSYRYHFLDGVNLLIHEAGHVVLGFLGTILGVLGGTILQLIFPLAFVVYFWRRHQRFEAGVCGVWAAESAMHTARYMADAELQLLPLVGGHIHDWNWLLTRAGLLGWCEELGQLLHVLASIAAVWALWTAAEAGFDWGGKGESAHTALRSSHR